MAQELEQLKEHEKKLLAKIKQLNPDKNEQLLIKRLRDESLLIKHGQHLPNDSDLASQLSSLVEEDFCDLRFVQRDGKVAALVQERTEKLSIN